MRKKIFNDWEITDKISEGSFGTVYKAIRSDGCVCAIKHISLPKNKSDMDRLIKMGVAKDYQDANKYFMNGISNEVEIMKRFNGNPYIVNCYEMFQENKQDGTGIDYYVRMEYVEDIKTYYSKGLIDIDEVVKLGIDICSSLELCSLININHNDIKPENVFVGDDGKYKLGDFGAAYYGDKIAVKSMGTLNYISPEVYNGKKASNNTDLYSLGLMMYQFINGSLPFVSKEIDEKGALDIRMSGKEIPVIRGLNKKLMEILSKACSFDEKNRYKNATEMKKDLERLPHINSKKIKVVFSTNKKYESTVDINDEKLLTSGSGTVIENKLSFNDKHNVKFIIIVLIVIGFASVIGVSYALNRSCDAGYVNKNGFCVSGYYYCEPGYSLNSDNKCQKTVESVDAKVTYKCPNGYTLNGEYCISNEVYTPEFVYKCADGFTLNENDKKCEKVESADAVITYSCPNGYVSAGKQCVTVANIEATPYYQCDDGGIINGTVCEYKVEPTVSSSWFFFQRHYECSKGTYDYSDNMCHYTENAKLSYTCPDGYVVAGNQCGKTASIDGTPKYTCTDGTELKNGKCYGKVTTDAVGMYTCPDGYVVSGTTCIQEDFQTAIKKYTCSRVYTLNGGKCEKYEIVSAKEHYYE